MIDRDKLARALEPWKNDLPAYFLHTAIIGGETDGNILEALTIHRWIERRDTEGPTTAWCSADHESWPCRTAFALGVRW